MTKHTWKLIPFATLIVLIIVVYLANLHTIFSLQWLRQEHLLIKEYVNQHPVIAPLIYIGFYTLSVCLAIPDSTILTLLGGLVFPLPLAITYAVFSEGIGALIFFQIFSLVFRAPSMRMNKPIIQKIQREIGSHPISYMLFLRISHVIPFWTVNIIAAYFRIKTWAFTWITFIGVIPLTYILANAGHSLSKEFAANQDLGIADIFTLQVKLALLVMGLLVITPLIYKNIARRKPKS